MKVTSLSNLFFQELQNIYSGETQIVEAMPQFIEKAFTQELKKALTKHFADTKNEAETIETLCKEFDIDPHGKHCTGIEGIIEEGHDLLMKEDSSKLTDLAIIAVIQKIEHYEISTYGTAANYAQEIGYSDAQDILYQIMQEEKGADEMLTAVAEQLIRDITGQDIIEATT